MSTVSAAHTEPGGDLGAWLAAVKDELGLDLALDVPALLDLAKVAAHAVARPAAPLTTFLVGYAAAAGGGGADAVDAAGRRVQDLAARWEAAHGTDAEPGAEASSEPGGVAG